MRTLEKTEHQFSTCTERDTLLTKMVFWYDMSLDVKRPYDRCVHAAAARSRSKSNLTYALTLMDKIGGWNGEKMGWTEICCVCEDFNQAVCNNKCRGEPSLDLDLYKE